MKCKKVQCPIHSIEPMVSNQNKAEANIRELKWMFMKEMTSKHVPEVLWDECLEWCALVRSHTALNIQELQGRTPMGMLTGDTPDISFLCEFGWYDWVWYITPADYDHGLRKKRLGRYSWNGPQWPQRSITSFPKDLPQPPG